MRRDDRGVSLLELIIAIAIIAILVGVITPQYIKYINKSRKSADMTTAAEIADVIQRGLVDVPEAYQIYENCNNPSVIKNVSVTVDGVTESYDVYLLMVNEKKYKYWFYGGMGELRWKSNDNIGFYNYINREFGFDKIMKGDGNWNSVKQNTELMPQYKVEPKTGLGANRVKLDRWRIVKRKDNGHIEIWSSNDSSWGGMPCYRVWPSPDDVYTKKTGSLYLFF